MTHGQLRPADVLAVRVAGSVVAPVAELRGPVPHRGQYEMGLLSVKSFSDKHLSRLDE
jgi:hypothetical protein